MATQLNIKDAETVRLVREHAARTGRSVTATVRAAIEHDRMALEVEVAERMRKADELIAEIRRNAPPEVLRMSSKDIMESLYDDDAEDGFAR